jgi:hypothetical protein
MVLLEQLILVVAVAAVVIRVVLEALVAQVL